MFYLTANFKPREDYVLPVEIEKEISPETSMSHRMRALKDLGEIVLNHRMEEVRYNSEQG